MLIFLLCGRLLFIIIFCLLLNFSWFWSLRILFSWLCRLRWFLFSYASSASSDDLSCSAGSESDGSFVVCSAGTGSDGSSVACSLLRTDSGSAFSVDSAASFCCSSPLVYSASPAGSDFSASSAACFSTLGDAAASDDVRLLYLVVFGTISRSMRS